MDDDDDDPAMLHSFANYDCACVSLQVHAAQQGQRLPEDLLGLVPRVRKVQVRDEVLGKEAGGK